MNLEPHHLPSELNPANASLSVGLAQPLSLGHNDLTTGSLANPENPKKRDRRGNGITCYPSLKPLSEGTLPKRRTLICTDPGCEHLARPGTDKCKKHSTRCAECSSRALFPLEGNQNGSPGMVDRCRKHGGGARCANLEQHPPEVRAALGNLEPACTKPSALGLTGKCFDCGGGYPCAGGRPDCTARNKKSKKWTCNECSTENSGGAATYDYGPPGPVEYSSQAEVGL
jgi:hypothetical protein